jgi:hypothetical protein
MVNRFLTAQSTAATRRLGGPAIVTLAAMAALVALTADAAARQARPAPTTEATAPREAGEPIMAIVSIRSQQVTFYDADGWILRAGVDRHHRTRDASGRVRHHREGHGPPLDPL